MKKIALAIITIVLLTQCTSDYPKQEFSMDSEFQSKNGKGEKVKVKYFHLLKDEIPDKVFERLIYVGIYETGYTLNYPLSYIPTKVTINTNGTNDGYTVMVDFIGKNGFNLEIEGSHIVHFNLKGMALNSALKKSHDGKIEAQAELMKLQGVSEEDIEEFIKAEDAEFEISRSEYY